MKKLITELQRLYFLPDQQWHSQRGETGAYAGTGLPAPEVLKQSLAGEATLTLNPLSSDGGVRLMVITFRKASHWKHVANLYLALQNELELPAPAISISAREGYGLWFSLANPVAASQAREFLAALHQRFLADIPKVEIRYCPALDGAAPAEADVLPWVPAFDPQTEKWSAFIDPNLGSMFADEPGLGAAPNMDKQAEILGGFASISPEEFQRALGLLKTDNGSEAISDSQSDKAVPSEPQVSPNYPTPKASRSKSNSNLASSYSDPQSFLLAVMNDPATSTRLRIKAAKALRPYFSSVATK